MSKFSNFFEGHVFKLLFGFSILCIVISVLGTTIERKRELPFVMDLVLIYPDNTVDTVIVDYDDGWYDTDESSGLFFGGRLATTLTYHEYTGVSKQVVLNSLKSYYLCNRRLKHYVQ